MKNIDYYLIGYCDLFGILRSKLVPAAAMSAMKKSGAGFAGFASYLDLSPADSDMFAMPDMKSAIRLPWKKEVAWVPADPHINGSPLAHAPRQVLKLVLARARKAGYVAKSGVECEYFLLTEEGKSLADSLDASAKPCYDQQALMRRYDFISEICNYMQELGWNPYQNDHEDANGQFEMNWEYADADVTADRHAFFKYMVKTVAESHGMRATFMPKPFAHTTGNGTHAHISLWDTAVEENLMHDANGELGLSDLAYNFIGGILKNAASLSAILSPVVNSYRRLHAAGTASGASWAPNSVTYGGNNRTHLIRIPDNDRIEIRAADGAVNPYLLQAGLIGAGLLGVQKEISAGKRLDINMYTHAHTVKDVPPLPDNLGSALQLFSNSSANTTIFGSSLVKAYSKLKTAEWQSYLQHFSDWERANAFDI